MGYADVLMYMIVSGGISQYHGWKYLGRREDAATGGIMENLSDVAAETRGRCLKVRDT